MASSCVSTCINDVRVPAAIRPTYVNLYKWPESDAEFVRSRSSKGRQSGQAHARYRAVDSLSCRQMYLRSYTFSRKKERVHEKISRKCFGRVKSRRKIIIRKGKSNHSNNNNKSGHVKCFKCSRFESLHRKTGLIKRKCVAWKRPRFESLHRKIGLVSSKCVVWEYPRFKSLHRNTGLTVRRCITWQYLKFKSLHRKTDLIRSKCVACQYPRFESLHCWQYLKNKRKCVVLKRVKEASCAALSLMFRRLLSCTAKVDVAVHDDHHLQDQEHKT